MLAERHFFTSAETRRMTLLDPPPSRIYLLRHAQSGWANPGERDFDRPLNDAGYAQAELIADRAADKGYKPDIILSSTAKRCRQTADAVKRAFHEQCDIVYVDEMYNAQPETYLALVSAQNNLNAVMLIGHNPTIEAVLEFIIGEDALHTSLPSGYPTAGLAVIDYMTADGSPQGQWQLTDFLSP
jgi:phosphohistidine phosphatase